LFLTASASEDANKQNKKDTELVRKNQWGQPKRGRASDTLFKSNKASIATSAMSKLSKSKQVNIHVVRRRSDQPILFCPRRAALASQAKSNQPRASI
jgi:hypothetical protein